MTLKITDVRVAIVDAFRANLVLVKIETDSGIYGWGEATVEFSEAAVAAAIETARPLLVGQDPYRINGLINELHRQTYFRTGVVLRSALSGIESALYDIKGKALGVPVYELLGGKTRDNIRCYANAWFTGARTPQDFAEKSKQVADLGYTALKWDPFGSSYMDMTADELGQSMDCIEAVRNAVPSSVDIIIEGHGRFNALTSRRAANAMAPYNPLWFEEPMPPESISAFASLKRQSPVPIATGERYYEPSSFFNLVAQEGADILQPDACHVGGFEAMRSIVSIAQANYVPVAPHNPMGPVANAMNMHLAAALDGVFIMETMMSDVPWRKDICDEDLLFKDGYMTFSDRPGLGIEINEDKCREHPYQQRFLRHYNGTLTDIRPDGETIIHREKPV
tara:strand:- start:132292 stop:133473 length:1182 start_codon:yes stop_codon:yes gene_type:complete